MGEEGRGILSGHRPNLKSQSVISSSQALKDHAGMTGMGFGGHDSDADF